MGFNSAFKGLNVASNSDWENDRNTQDYDKQL